MNIETTILNGNKLIAEFMGWKYDYSGINWAVPSSDDLLPKPHKGSTDNYLSGCRVPDNKLVFHKEWRHLMAVIEHIESMGYYFEIKRNLVHITGAPGNDPDYSWYGGMTDDNKLVSCWYGCVGFIEYYNTKLDAKHTT